MKLLIANDVLDLVVELNKLIIKILCHMKSIIVFKL